MNLPDAPTQSFEMRLPSDAQKTQFPQARPVIAEKQQRKG